MCKAAPKGVCAGLKGGAGREAQLPSAPEARLNREIERHACSVGVFPSKVSVIRLIGSVLTEENECSSTQRKSYYGLDLRAAPAGGRRARKDSAQPE
ncbi:MAG: hypothetical protein DUD39_18425 [Coriobacteriaceae bacterium]|nr:MAG: hypothetical protein DUD39_18425 [Coriobacteriaceae bacterium]